MSKITKCDFCEKHIANIHNGVISGESKYAFEIEQRFYNTIITFIESTGDRLDIDICKDCLKKGGIGK